MFKFVTFKNNRIRIYGKPPKLTCLLCIYGGYIDIMSHLYKKEICSK